MPELASIVYDGDLFGKVSEHLDGYVKNTRVVCKGWCRALDSRVKFLRVDTICMKQEYTEKTEEEVERGDYGIVLKPVPLKWFAGKFPNVETLEISEQCVVGVEDCVLFNRLQQLYVETYGSTLEQETRKIDDVYWANTAGLTSFKLSCQAGLGGQKTMTAEVEFPVREVETSTQYPRLIHYPRLKGELEIPNETHMMHAFCGNTGDLSALLKTGLGHGIDAWAEAVAGIEFFKRCKEIVLFVTDRNSEAAKFLLNQLVAKGLHCVMCVTERNC